MIAVAAFPKDLRLLVENRTGFDRLERFAAAFLVAFFDGRNLLAAFLGHGCEVGVLFAGLGLAGKSLPEILSCFADFQIRPNNSSFG